jgi:hypothetical protein
VRRLHHFAAAILFAALLVSSLVAGAAEPSVTKDASPPCIASIHSDTSRLSTEDLTNPTIKQFIANAEQMCRVEFIPLHELLYPGQPLPERLSAKLVYLRQDDGIAWCSGGEVTINIKWFAGKPDDVGAIYHELAHVVQAYPANADCHWLVEGIADWARYFVYEQHDLAYYADRPPGSYRDAYTNAARFLEWLRLNKNSNIVTGLNAHLKAGEYSADNDWPELAGAGLDSLWTEYAAITN